MKTSTLTTFYHVLDSLLCLLLLFPSMVLYWRGIWDLWGYYLNYDVWAIFGVGNIILLGYLVQPALERYIPQRPRVLYHIIIRVYIYIFGAFLMCFWRGCWDTMDDLLGVDLPNNLSIYIVGYIILLISRASRSCIFPPMFAVDDMREDVLKPATRFGQEPYSWKYLLDSLFTHLLLLITIVTWRSMWNVIILFMFSDPLKRDLSCMVIGYCLVFIFYALEEPLAWVTLRAEKRSWWWKLAWEDGVYTAIMFSLGFLWIGCWNLVETYCMPSIPDGAWACHVIGTVLLMSTQQFGFVSTCGIVVDGAEEGRDAIFPSLFLRNFVLPKQLAKKVAAMPEDLGHDNHAMTVGSSSIYSIHSDKAADNQQPDVNNNNKVQEEEEGANPVTMD